MQYLIYKNCSEADFLYLKEKLRVLGEAIERENPGRLKRDEGTKSVDALVLNYRIVDKQPYLSNLAIVFLDCPGEFRFDLAIIKALDRNKIRYSKKKKIVDAGPFSLIEANIENYIAAALKQYDQWSEADVLGGDSIELPG